MADNEVGMVNGRIDSILTEMRQGFAALAHEIAELRTTLQTHVTKCEACRDMVERHETQIRGNGKVGLIEQQIRVENRLDTLERSSRQLSSLRRDALIAVIGLLSAIIGGSVTVAGEWLLK